MTDRKKGEKENVLTLVTTTVFFLWFKMKDITVFKKKKVKKKSGKLYLQIILLSFNKISSVKYN